MQTYHKALHIHIYNRMLVYIYVYHIYNTMTLPLLNIPFEDVFHTLMIISSTFAIAIFHPTFGAPSFTPA